MTKKERAAAGPETTSRIAVKNYAGKSPWQLAFLRLVRNRIALFSLLIVALYIVAAFVTRFNVFGIHDTAATHDYENRFVGFLGMGRSMFHIFGTDNFGRDVLSRAILGSQVSLFLGFTSGLIMIPIAILVGAIAGYYGGILDDVAMYIMSVIVAIPGMLIILSLIQIVGRSFWTIALAFAVTGWVGLARVIRGSFIQSREFEYVLAAHTLGASDYRIIFKHILPNSMHFVIIRFVLNFVGVIKSEVFLAYIGLSIIGASTWGNMIDESKQEIIAGNWQNLVAASVFMIIFLVCLNLLGDAIRDALDPKLKNV